MTEAVDRFFLRLPEGLRQTLKRIAKKNRRSLNAEIVARMERSLAGPHSRDLDRAGNKGYSMGLHPVADENDSRGFDGKLNAANTLVERL
ncbi:Arc family DNA-binding protein [Pseudomonas chlororaphis]|uniref:Arc-like DNA binding domain-containing protein n=1 Tax=Pseudomonas chlororaphis TaxID=587753 RepID=A0A1Q8EQ50_9PSED|nr:Arc family DNA-binding protein [Pseudomonas chlororaphis]OLF53909.1 hypothetical protein BTN82_12675 [Pseudomonas chlororaphis]